MKASPGSGVISNFFLWKPDSELADVFWEEVDIEVFGKDGGFSWQSNIITGLGSRTTSEQVHTAPQSFSADYHTYSIEWTPDKVLWQIDGVTVRETENGQASQLQSPAQARFNFWPPSAVAWVGEFDEQILPAHMFVNWLEYHRWTEDGFELAWRDDFDTFNASRWNTANWTFAENRADFSPENVTVKNGYLVLSMTMAEATGYTGTPPVDSGLSPTPEPTPVATPEPTTTPTPAPTPDPTVLPTATPEPTPEAPGEPPVSPEPEVTPTPDLSDLGECNWYGTLYPLCDQTTSGWGWENSHSCVSTNSCGKLPQPYGITYQEPTQPEQPSPTPGVPVPPQNPGSANVVCEIINFNQWGSGYQLDVSLKNTGDVAQPGWTVSLQFEQEAELNNGWSAVYYEQGNEIIASNLDWNARIAPGHGISFGLTGHKQGTINKPECIILD